MRRLLVLAAGCGRLGFSEAPEATTDAAPIADAMPAQLSCAQPGHAMIGDADTLATVALTGGVALFSGTGGAVHGWSYGIDPSGALVAYAQDAAIATDPTEQFSVAARGDRVLVAAVADKPATTTSIRLLDASLTAVTTSERADVAAAVAPAPDGWAYVAWDGELHGQLLDAAANDAGARVDLTTADGPSEPVMIATPGGYALAYVETTSSPHLAMLSVLDGDLAKTHQAAAGCPSDAEHAQVSFAAQSQRYLVTYMDKEPGDAIYAVEYDAQLNVVRAPMLLAKSAYVPKVGTDGTAFYLAWTDEGTDALAGARIDASGALTAMTYAGGDNPAQWTLVTNAGQALIAWRTDDAAGDVTIAAICP